MAHTRAADDFQAIRARMEELRRERERSKATRADRGSVQPARRDNSDLLAISFHKGIGRSQRNCLQIQSLVFRETSWTGSGNEPVSGPWIDKPTRWHTPCTAQLDATNGCQAWRSSPAPNSWRPSRFCPDKRG
jgi:hypothetical protein